MPDQTRYDELRKRWLHEPDLPDAEYFEFQRLHAEREALKDAPKAVAAPPTAARPVKAEPEETPKEKAEREEQEARDTLRFHEIGRRLRALEIVSIDDAEFRFDREALKAFEQIYADLRKGLTVGSVAEAIASVLGMMAGVRIAAYERSAHITGRLAAIEAALPKPRARVKAPSRPAGAVVESRAD